MVRFLPGFVAAIAAYAALKLIGWVKQSLSFEILLFFCTYAAVSLVVDAAMKKYGRNNS